MLGAALLLYARFVEPARLTVRTRTVQAEGLSCSLKVVFLTDTHFGRWYDVDRAARLVDAINARQPDVVLFGGDLLDNYAWDRDSLTWRNWPRSWGAFRRRAASLPCGATTIMAAVRCACTRACWKNGTCRWWDTTTCSWAGPTRNCIS